MDLLLHYVDYTGDYWYCCRRRGQQQHPQQQQQQQQQITVDDRKKMPFTSVMFGYPVFYVMNGTPFQANLAPDSSSLSLCLLFII